MYQTIAGHLKRLSKVVRDPKAKKYLEEEAAGWEAEGKRAAEVGLHYHIAATKVIQDLLKGGPLPS
jgi:hypothetical protein